MIKTLFLEKIKLLNMSIDNNVKTRDLGMSFLLSYNELKAKFVYVLHPLFYLIKQTNFKLLKGFSSNYQSDKDLTGRCVNQKEFSEFLFNKNNYFIFLEIIKVFDMLSVLHQNDRVQIVPTISGDL